MNKGTPTVTEMQVIPVAGYDSMLMTLSGCHAPYFTRNLVILKDSAGHTGIGEIHGGDYTCEALKSCIPLVVGQQVGADRDQDHGGEDHQPQHGQLVLFQPAPHSGKLAALFIDLFRLHRVLTPLHTVI